MSQISFSGEEISRRVPLLAEFHEHLLELVNPMIEVAACRWADGVDDEMSIQMRESVRKMVNGYILPVYAELGESLGFQGDKLSAFRRIGDQTEHNAAGAAGFTGGGGRH
jgi:hypothetical protein